MRLRNTPVLAAAADGKWIGRRHIRERMHGFSTCPMLYEFARAHHIGLRLIIGDADGKVCRYFYAVPDKARQVERTTNGVWQQRATPSKAIRGVEHSNHGRYH
jgi:hypothetical protein